MGKTNIQHIVMMGDSLSDRGTMEKKKLFGFIPMDSLSGLHGKSPKGRFTNGYVWSDALATKIANELIISRLKKRGEKDTDIADGVITHSAKIKKLLDFYDLDHDTYVEYNKSLDLIRNYDEGGLTAYNYRGSPGPLGRIILSQVLSNLDEKRKKLFEDDDYRAISPMHKSKTLVIEWSGGNDLITINNGVYQLVDDKLSDEVEKEIAFAVEARINNVRKMAKNGYKHFILFNLPDLSLTPLFQTGYGKDSVKGAHVASLRFNEVLQQQCEKLKKELSSQYDDVDLAIYDVASVFKDAYENPKKYGIDKDKRTTPYIDSEDFKIKKNGTSPADGYMFYDMLHPTEDMHEILAQIFYDSDTFQHYEMQAPNENLIAQFREAYGARLELDQTYSFITGWMYQSNIDYKSKDLSLHQILKHALGNDGSGSGMRTRQVIEKLGWIDTKGNIIIDNSHLHDAYNLMKQKPLNEKLNTL
jgi:phospholipase/lecithinase/hemolysin